MLRPFGDRVDVVELARKVLSGQPYGLDLGERMMQRDPDEDARRLAAESLAGGDATGWFERLYAGSETGETIVPWDAGRAHPLLVEWLTDAGSGPGAEGETRTPSGRELPEGKGRRALVVGCGLGDDAEYVASLGYETDAFDVSESAIRLAGERFPGTGVAYRTADLLNPPDEWRQAFDLVVEIMTVQALPEELHARATAEVAGFVRPGGTLLVIASGREEGGPVFAPPWPLTRSELAAFAADGLTEGEVEDLREPGRHRWRASFHRPT
jgi:SAM-dependent methyltransferase